MLVKMQYMSLEDLVRKTSVNPARMLGLTSKGSLSQGKDADITAPDLEAFTASTAIAGGRVIMKDKEVMGTGAP